jgi:hypothetical protein
MMATVGLFMSSIVLAAKPDKNFHIYLCFGQSNMEGTAKNTAVEKKPTKDFYVFRANEGPKLEGVTGEWHPGQSPLCATGRGLSPAFYFAKTMKEKNKKAKIGVIVVAVGGADIRLFNKSGYEDYTDKKGKAWFSKKVAEYGKYPYRHLLEMAKLAQKDGVIKGILLHQGETNAGDKQWAIRVGKIYEDLLADLNLKREDVPLIAGEVLGEDQKGKCAHMNKKIIQKLPGLVKNAHVISSKGCKAKSDRLHFSTEGVREMGKRYAEKMISLQ